MLSSLSARLTLIAVLVFSQMLYVGHSIMLDSGSQTDCQICLQASASGAALPASGIDPTVPVYAPERLRSYIAPAARVHFTLSHPSRAPPLFPL